MKSNWIIDIQIHGENATWNCLNNSIIDRYIYIYIQKTCIKKN